MTDRYEETEACHINRITICLRIKKRGNNITDGFQKQDKWQEGKGLLMEVSRLKIHRGRAKVTQRPHNRAFLFC